MNYVKGSMTIDKNGEKSNLTHIKYRPDIDGLRTIAVLFVVYYHAFPDWFKGGFIWVDIFLLFRVFSSQPLSLKI
jgi:hypothetical protein